MFRNNPVERVLKDNECLLDVMKKWKEKDGNKFIFAMSEKAVSRISVRLKNRAVTIEEDGLDSLLNSLTRYVASGEDSTHTPNASATDTSKTTTVSTNFT